MFRFYLPKRFSKRFKEKGAVTVDAVLSAGAVLTAFATIVVLGAIASNDSQDQVSVARCSDVVNQALDLETEKYEVVTPEYVEGTVPYATLTAENKAQAIKILEQTEAKGCGYLGADTELDIEKVDTNCNGGIPEVWHYRSTPGGFAAFDRLPGGCLLLPGDVCIDSCGNDNFYALHDSCVDTSGISLEIPESDYDNFTVRDSENGHLGNLCDEDKQFNYSDFETIEDLITVYNPIMVIRQGDTWLRIPWKIEEKTGTPEETPRPAASCTIGGQTREHGPNNLVLYRKKNQYNVQNCEPQAQRAKLTVVCNDGKFIVDGDREITADELNTYSLVYEPCDCNSTAGVIAHGTTRMFYTESDSYDCAQAGCPQAERRCNDKTLEGDVRAIHAACTNHTDRCMENLMKQVSNPAACAAILSTNVLDRGNLNFCQAISQEIYGAQGKGTIVGGKCEIKQQIASEDINNYQTRWFPITDPVLLEEFRKDLRYQLSVPDRTNADYRMDLLEDKVEDSRRSRRQRDDWRGSLSESVDRANNTVSNRFADYLRRLNIAPENVRSRIERNNKAWMFRVDTPTGTGMKRALEGGGFTHFHNFYDKGRLKSRTQFPVCEQLESRVGAGMRLGDLTDGGDKATQTRDQAWLIQELGKFNLDSSVLNGNKIRVRKGGGQVGEYDYDFVSCSSSCIEVDIITFNSPIMISLNGLMPKGVIDARFSYDGKTVVDTKWPIFDASEPIGFLAYDFNGNGTIDDGTELFGEYTGGERFQHGYDALSYFFDGNGDGVVTGAELEGLMMWKDINGDGKGSADELSSIVSYGITELDSGKNTEAARLELEGGHASPVSLERGVVWTDERGFERFGASFDVWYLKKEE